jgi:DNA end-binding protein Ku
MARSIWKGSISFGLVNVPVALFSGVKDTDVHFHQLHAKDHVPIETRRYCAEEDEEVPYEEIASGYELDDELVVLSDAELAAAAPHRSRTIDIEAFVDVEDVDPIYFDHPYVVMPSGESEGTQRAYRLLVEVMERSERAALGRFVLRTKEYMTIVRARRERLTLTTMRFHDEVRDPPKTPGKRPAKKQLDTTVKLIEALAEPWDPTRYRDEYEKRLKKIIRDKQNGKTVKAPEREEQPSPIEDLMAALERSLEEVNA